MIFIKNGLRYELRSDRLDVYENSDSQACKSYLFEALSAYTYGDYDEGIPCIRLDINDAGGNSVLEVCSLEQGEAEFIERFEQAFRNQIK